jgi:hypothetical protein
MKSRLLIALLLLSSIAFSQDRLFTYTYQSTVLNKGQREIEVWNTFHWGRADYYRSFRNRIEFEVGLSNRLQTSFYLNTSTETALETSITQQGSAVVAASELVSDHEFSFSNEWKYKMSDPVANGIGSALYGELEISGSEVELEAKIILDKKIGRAMHALNLVVEPEFESEIEDGEVEQEIEFSFEAAYGLMYNLNKSWNIGFELRDLNKSSEDKGWEYSTLFGGPGFSYVAGNFWVNFTAMPQIAGIYHGSKTAFTDGKELDEHEKLETRLMFSYVF